MKHNIYKVTLLIELYSLSRLRAFCTMLPHLHTYVGWREAQFAFYHLHTSESSTFKNIQFLQFNWTELTYLHPYVSSLILCFWVLRVLNYSGTFLTFWCVKPCICCAPLPLVTYWIALKYTTTPQGISY